MVNKSSSLYFKPIQFKFKTPPEVLGIKNNYKVVIVGAGPVGLTAALELKKYNIDSIILSKGNTINRGSRAICISRQSMEIFQKIGVSKKIKKIGLGWTKGKSFYKGKKVFDLKMLDSSDERFKPMTNLQQSILEKILYEKTQEDKIEIRWSSEVVEVLKNRNYVKLNIKTPKGFYTINTDYLIAADGAKSSIRDALGIKFIGESYTGNYLISDIKIKINKPTERLAYFYPNANPNSTILMHKQPKNIWRIDYQLENRSDLEKENNEKRVKKRIQEQLNYLRIKSKWQLDWWSLYQAHCLTIEKYVHNRIIFVGDAAHLVPIFGVRGLNSGIADINNLVWRLSQIIKLKKSKALLKFFNKERKQAIEKIFSLAKKSTIFMTPPSNGYQLMQQAVLSLSIRNKFSRPLINPRQSDADIYLYDKLNKLIPSKSKFKIGQTLVNIKFKKGFLFDYTPNSFFVISFKRIPESFPLPVIYLKDSLYGSFFYLVRPDRYIAGVWEKYLPKEFLKNHKFFSGD